MDLIDNIITLFKGLKEDGRGIILIAIGGGWFIIIGTRMILPVLLPFLRDSYSMSLSTAGTLITTLWLSYGIGHLPGGFLADQIGEGRTLFVSIIFSAVSLILIIASSSTVLLFVATSLLGLSNGMYGVARFTALYDIFSDAPGTVIGVVNSASDLGQSILPIIASVIAVGYLWEFGIGFTLPVFLFFGVMVWVYVPSRTGSSENSLNLNSRKNLRIIGNELISLPVLQATLILILGLVIWQTFTGFYPTYLIEVKGLPQVTTSTVFGIFFALGIFVHPLVGRSHDIVGFRLPLVILLGLTGIGFGLLPFANETWQIILLTILISPFPGWATSIMTRITETLSENIRSSALGIIRSISWIIAAISPVIFSRVAERGFFDELFFALGVVCLTMIGIIMLGDGSTTDEA